MPDSYDIWKDDPQGTKENFSLFVQLFAVQNVNMENV